MSVLISSQDETSAFQEYFLWLYFDDLKESDEYEILNCVEWKFWNENKTEFKKKDWNVVNFYSDLNSHYESWKEFVVIIKLKFLP